MGIGDEAGMERDASMHDTPSAYSYFGLPSHTSHTRPSNQNMVSNFATSDEKRWEESEGSREAGLDFAQEPKSVAKPWEMWENTATLRREDEGLRAGYII